MTKTSTSPLYMELPYKHERAAPSFDSAEDKFPDTLVRTFLERYTKQGDKVFDPFAGLGTTLFTAEDMGRIPYGIEHDERRYEWVAGQLEHWTNMACADAGDMNECGLPKMNFCITSPPFMAKNHQWNPLYGGDPAYAGYDNYLKRMGDIFATLSDRMKRGAYIAVHLDNLKRGNIYTPLVRDVSLQIERSMRLDAEIMIRWTSGTPPAYPHTHCLLFKNIKSA